MCARVSFYSTMLPKEGGRIGPVQWARMGRDYLRTPRFNPLEMTAANKSVLAFNLSFLFDRQDIFEPAMDEIIEWVDNGKLRLPAVASYALADVRRAHAALESGQTVGKLVLIPRLAGTDEVQMDAAKE
jgi:NADPH:quinone reductase-like Zn-dependent oxidoreductase